LRLRVTLLGTGGSAGVPMLGGPDGHGDWGVCDRNEPRNRRTRASLVVQSESGTLLVDTGPELRLQLLAAGIARVDAVLFTHAHADHIVGLDELRILNRIVGRPIDAFANAATLAELSRRFDYAFRPWTPPDFFRPVLATREVAPGESVTMAGMQVTVFDQDHGFSRSLGLRVGGFAYSTDAVALDEAALAALDGVETWVVGCYQRAPHTTHAWLGRVLDWSARVGPRRTVLTHMGTDLDWSWLQQNLPAGVEPGYDGQVLEIDD
jgi:phosphoribosyl 1,2-cyclic phosphate phosphodiesterase